MLCYLISPLFKSYSVTVFLISTEPSFFLNSGSLPSPYLYGFLLQYCRCRITNNHCCQRAEVQQAGQYTVDRNHNCKLYQSSRHDRIEVVTKHDYKTSCCKYQRTENCSHHDRYTDTNCFSGFLSVCKQWFRKSRKNTPEDCRNCNKRVYRITFHEASDNICT